MMQTAAFYENHGGVAHFSVSNPPPFGQLKSPTEGDPRLEASLAMQHKRSKGLGNRAEDSVTFSLQLSLPEHSASFELGLGQFSNGHILLPMNIVARGPIYVNAKQFHGILRRRQARAKAERDNRSLKVRKPYLHELWHLHARHWARGSNGRFVNTKKEGSRGGNSSSLAASPSSEVLQADGRNLNSKSFDLSLIPEHGQWRAGKWLP